MADQDMCPICTLPFKKDDAIIKFQIWGQKTKTLAHLDCALYRSQGEKRKHPPNQIRPLQRSK
jgi:hypothetical protein